VLRTLVFFFQAEDGIRDDLVTGVQTCALPISLLETAGHENQAGVAQAVLASFVNLPPLELISAPLSE